MTLRELRYLVALADLGHFGRAAEACHVSQPTLSTQLRKLEDSLGVALFERTNRMLRITPIGEQIVAKARWVLDEADSIVSLARRRSGPLTGPFALGVIPTLGPYLLPWLLPPLEREFPDLDLVVHEDLTERLLDQLEAHRLDAALTALPIDHGELNALPIFDEPFRLVLPPGHRLVGASGVNQSELSREHLLLLREGHCLRDQALEVCRFESQPGASRGTDIRAASLETVCRMVAAGLGCTLLPAMALDGAGHNDFEVCPLDAEASRRIGLIWRQSYSRTLDLEISRPDDSGQSSVVGPCGLAAVLHRFTAADVDLTALAALWPAIHGAPPSGALRATESAPGGFVNATRVFDPRLLIIGSGTCGATQFLLRLQAGQAIHGSPAHQDEVPPALRPIPVRPARPDLSSPCESSHLHALASRIGEMLRLEFEECVALLQSSAFQSGLTIVAIQTIDFTN